jgi:hypothetical protein
MAAGVERHPEREKRKDIDMRVKTLVALAGAGAVGASAAAGPLHWGVISTSGDPDPIHAFDLANPIGTQTQIGTVQGNFNRGMDFDTFNSFYYYVSTDALNDPGDRGLWYWNNGVNTQLFNTSFDDSGDGDATLSRDRNTFYVTTNDGDGTTGDSLYAFNNINGAVTFTEVGETGLSDLIGIAVDPISGLLYGYDAATEALYTISTTDGSTSLIGASGQSVASIGGMDFSADGSTLLLADGSDELFSIDTSDGSMTSAGDMSLNVSALSFRVPGPGTIAPLALLAVAGRRRRS